MASPACSGEHKARPDADPDHDQIGLDHAAALQRGAFAVELFHGVLEVKVDAVLFMQRADEIAHLGAEHTLHRPLLGRNHMHLQLARPQGGRDFEANEAGADHQRALRAARRLDDGAAVGNGAQGVHVRLVRARNLQFDRLGAGREQQPVERQLVAIAERDGARLRIDRCNVGVEPEIDARVLIIVLAPQRQPILGCTAGEVILGEVRPVDRHRAVIAQHGDGAGKALAPKRLGGRKAGRTTADDDEFFRRRRAAM